MFTWHIQLFQNGKGPSLLSICQMNKRGKTISKAQFFFSLPRLRIFHDVGKRVVCLKTTTTTTSPTIFFVWFLFIRVLFRSLSLQHTYINTFFPATIHSVHTTHTSFYSYIVCKCLQFRSAAKNSKFESRKKNNFFSGMFLSSLCVRLLIVFIWVCMYVCMWIFWVWFGHFSFMQWDIFFFQSIQAFIFCV